MSNMKTSTYKRDRPTIGVLLPPPLLDSGAEEAYVVAIWSGIRAAARVRQCHVLLEWELSHPVENDTQPISIYNTDFVPISPQNTDALIVLTPILNESRKRHIQQWAAEGFPILFIGTGENGPSVAMNNADGVDQAVSHLVEHGHRCIAFIAGNPNDPGDSRQRLHAYHAAVKKYGLESDPRLVVHGWHATLGGERAMRELLSSGTKFTAVLASNDPSAIGAMRAIRKAGLRIPDDVAIIGFDDQPDDIAQVPPLASIHAPLKLIGEQALVAIVDHLVDNIPLESLQIPIRLIPRRSCGCLSRAVLASADSVSPVDEASVDESDTPAERVHRIRQQMVTEMVAVLPAEARLPEEERTYHFCNKLVESFFSSLEARDPHNFQSTLTEFLQEMELADGIMEPWQEIISVLRREAIRTLNDAELARSRQLMEDLLHQARVAISEGTLRQDHRHQYENNRKAFRLSLLSALLSASLDANQAVAALGTHGSEVGIRHTRVMLFEAEGENRAARSVVINPDPDAPAIRFPTREFPPPELYPSGETLCLALLPLVYQDEIFGYVAFDTDDVSSCSALARQLAGTLKLSQLHSQVVELSLTDPLTGLYNRRYFDLFLHNEVVRSRRTMRGLAVLMIDIDHFKNYNDTYGHPEGDIALQEVANCLRQDRRHLDVIARLGGEEFGAILPETNSAGAARVAEKMRNAVAASSALKLPITISVGVTNFDEISNQSPETLVKQADEALYEAKRKGRDQVCIFGGEPGKKQPEIGQT